MSVCGIGATTGTVITPFNTVYGNCGSASITMGDSSTNGYAQITWHIHSTQGWILGYGVDVVYSGTAHAGTVGFSGYPLDVIDAGDYTNVHTGVGWADAYLSGTVETVLADCGIGYPDVSHYVG